MGLNSPVSFATCVEAASLRLSAVQQSSTTVPGVFLAQPPSSPTGTPQQLPNWPLTVNHPLSPWGPQWTLKNISFPHLKKLPLAFCYKWDKTQAPTLAFKDPHDSAPPLSPSPQPVGCSHSDLFSHEGLLTYFLCWEHTSLLSSKGTFPTAL